MLCFLKHLKIQKGRPDSSKVKATLSYTLFKQRNQVPDTMCPKTFFLYLAPASVTNTYRHLKLPYAGLLIIIGCTFKLDKGTSITVRQPRNQYILMIV